MVHDLPVVLLHKCVARRWGHYPPIRHFAWFHELKLRFLRLLWVCQSKRRLRIVPFHPKRSKKVQGLSKSRTFPQTKNSTVLIDREAKPMPTTGRRKNMEGLRQYLLVFASLF
jgi:hypothetical protein